MKRPTYEVLLAELAALAGHSTDRAVQVSVSELARRLGVSERTVQRARADLARSGRLVVEQPSRRYTPSRYTLVA